jgi:hypothetical protein
MTPEDDEEESQTYQGPCGSFWRDGVWYDSEGEPMPRLSPGEAWVCVETWVQDF